MACSFDAGRKMQEFGKATGSFTPLILLPEDVFRGL
jgi:hypothetical protein